jgi:hypothetical protein
MSVQKDPKMTLEIIIASHHIMTIGSFSQFFNQVFNGRNVRRHIIHLQPMKRCHIYQK